MYIQQLSVSTCCGWCNGVWTGAWTRTQTCAPYVPVVVPKPYPTLTSLSMHALRELVLTPHMLRNCSHATAALTEGVGMEEVCQGGLRTVRVMVVRLAVTFTYP